MHSHFRPERPNLFLAYPRSRNYLHHPLFSPSLSHHRRPIIILGITRAHKHTYTRARSHTFTRALRRTHAYTHAHTLSHICCTCCIKPFPNLFLLPLVTVAERVRAPDSKPAIASSNLQKGAKSAPSDCNLARG